jgi:hypothetical protein
MRLHSQAGRTTRRYAHFGTRRHVSIVLINLEKIKRSLEFEHSIVQIGTNSRFKSINQGFNKIREDFGVFNSRISLFLTF